MQWKFNNLKIKQIYGVEVEIGGGGGHLADKEQTPAAAAILRARGNIVSRRWRGEDF